MSRRSVALLIVLSAVLTGSFRFLATAEFNNDHFVHLAAAQQVLFGDWPTRDFIDIGRPLQIVASAVAQRVIGPDLFAEAILVSAAYGLAAALTAAVVVATTGSPLAAAGAVLVEVVAFPRTYSYPKVLAIAAGLWLIGHFLRNPVRGRRMLMAAGVGIAFVLRHDLGMFVAIGGLVASMVAAPAATWQQRCRSALTFAALVVTFVLPYLIYVQANGGLSNYVATALEQNRLEPGYVWPNPFTAGSAWDAQLLYAFHLLPVLALGISLVHWKGGDHSWRTGFIIATACLAISLNFGLIRDVIRARIPDAIVPFVVLGAWLAHPVSPPRPRYVAIAAGIGFVVAGLALADAANIVENLNRAGLDSRIWSQPGLLRVRFAERSAQLHDRVSGSSPSRTALVLRPFFRYLDRCTTREHRLFLGGLIPEVAYLAQRPFAGGGYEHYNFSSLVNQQKVVDRLRTQLTPFAVIPAGGDSRLEDFPIVSTYIRRHYRLLSDVPIAGEEHVQILVNQDLPSTSRDRETGWPCFT